MSLTKEEYELRRSTKFSRSQNLDQEFKTATYEYIIFYENIRYNVTNGICEVKNKISAEYVIFFDTFIEVSHYSMEKILDTVVVPLQVLRLGKLALKKTYLRKNDLVFYSIHFLDKKLYHYDKIVIELEKPYQEYQLFHDMSLRYNLECEYWPKTSFEKVKHLRLPSATNNPPVFVLNKIDGTRGRIIFLKNNNIIFNGDIKSFILPGNILNEFGRELSFFLRNIPLVAELVSEKLIIIDLAISDIRSDLRMKIIYNLAKIVRKNVPCSTACHVFFQLYDENFISKHFTCDGKIFIYQDGSIIKSKTELTIDVLYIGNGRFRDRDGIIYDLYENFTTTSQCGGLKLFKNVVYEAIKEKNRILPLKYRRDKFFANTHKVIVDIAACSR